MDGAYSEAREILPNMPEEIFTLWFDGRIKNNGWPPVTNTWAGALRGKDLEYWKKLVWKKETVKIEYGKFTAKSQHIISGLIEANFLNEPNIYSLYLHNSKVRISKIMSHISAHKKLPDPLILLEDNGCYEIVDGSHRLAVFFALSGNHNLKLLLEDTQEAWIGRLPLSQDKKTQ